MTEERAKVLLENAHEVIIEAEKAKGEYSAARKGFVNLSRVAIASIFLAISIISINFYIQKKQGEDINTIKSDYVPFWVVDDLMENYKFMTLDLVAQFGGDKKKAEEISVKYMEFKKQVINQMSQKRGGRHI
jgi:hypothetical protein